MSDIDHDAKIQELVREIRLYKDPEQLEQLKKTIKKNVPFSMRGYFMAYLYTCLYSKNSGLSGKSSVSKVSAPVKRPELDNATSFYVNVGKASRSSSKELAQFICEKTGISSEDILSIAFKQNYSFVYIKKDKADNVIESVTGQVFKGRKVKMNFSKESGLESGEQQ